MKVGDLVKAYSTVDWQEVPVAGIIIDFNTAGDGGKDFVHVLAEDGTIKIFHAFDVEVISASR